MICESGHVVSIDGPWAMVETYQMSSCKTCSAKAGCGQQLLGSVFAGKRHLVKVSAQKFLSDLAIGDQVELAIDEKAMLKGSFLVYLLPLMLMIAGAVVAPMLVSTTGDLPALMGAATGFILACSLLRGFSLSNANNPQFQPVIHKILQSQSSMSADRSSAVELLNI